MVKTYAFFSSNYRIYFILLVLISIILLPFPAQAGSAGSASAYAAGDIQFCPKGKAYEDPSCSVKRTALNDAIQDALDAAQNGTSGTIYLEEGHYSSTNNDYTGDPISISSFNYGTSLTIQGGAKDGSTGALKGNLTLKAGKVN